MSSCRAVRVVIDLALIVLIVGCGSVGATVVPSAPSTRPSSTPSPTPSAPAPTPTLVAPGVATPSPMTWGQAVFVTGWERCAAAPGPITYEPDGIASHMRNGELTCLDDASDPRVSGKITGTFEGDGWGTSTPPDAMVEWGSLRLVTDRGGWDGRYTGVYTSQTGDMISAWFRGTGEYAGLSYFQWVEAAPGEVLSGYRFVGLIYPGDAPEP